MDLQMDLTVAICGTKLTSVTGKAQGDADRHLFSVIAALVWQQKTGGEIENRMNYYY